MSNPFFARQKELKPVEQTIPPDEAAAMLDSFSKDLQSMSELSADFPAHDFFAQPQTNTPVETNTPGEEVIPESFDFDLEIGALDDIRNTILKTTPENAYNPRPLDKKEEKLPKAPTPPLEPGPASLSRNWSGSEITQEIAQTPQPDVPTPPMQESLGLLDPALSDFFDSLDDPFQELNISENPPELPPGAKPRSQPRSTWSSPESKTKTSSPKNETQEHTQTTISSPQPLRSNQNPEPAPLSDPAPRKNPFLARQPEQRGSLPDDTRIESPRSLHKPLANSSVRRLKSTQGSEASSPSGTPRSTWDDLCSLPDTTSAHPDDTDNGPKAPAVPPKPAPGVNRDAFPKSEGSPHLERGDSKRGHQLLGRLSSKAKMPSLLPRSQSGGGQKQETHVMFADDGNPNNTDYSFEPLTFPETNFEFVELGQGYYSFHIFTTLPLILSASEALCYLIHFTPSKGAPRTIVRQYSEFREFHDALVASRVFSKFPKFPKLGASLNTNSNPKLNHLSTAQLEHYLHAVFLSKPESDDALEKQPFVVQFLTDTSSAQGGSYATARGFIEQKCNSMPILMQQCEEILNNLKCINNFFTTIIHPSDWPRASLITKQILDIGTLLEKKPTEPKFVPTGLPKSAFSEITDKGLLAFREMITIGISEISSKIKALLSSTLLNRLEQSEIDAIKSLTKEILDKFTSPLIAPLAGWSQESGTSDCSLTRWPSYIRENCPWYNDYFLNHTHTNLVGIDPTGESPFVVSLVFGQHQGTEYFRGIGRSKDGFKKVIAPAAPEQHPDKWERNPSALRSLVLEMYPTMKSVPQLDLNLSSHDDFGLELLKTEAKDMKATPKFKFAVLYCAPNQTVEEEMFSNEYGSDSFNSFLELLGDRYEQAPRAIRNLEFNGGLDVRGDNTTGTESVFTFFKGYDVMFHVAPLLPFSPGNTQQLHKKRHLGNDIVMIVFQDYGSEPYIPNCVKSQFIQIVIVIRPTCPASSNPTHYHVSITQQAELTSFGPPLPIPAVFEHGPYFRSWLLSKMVNGELCAYRSAVFNQRHRDAYRGIVQDLVTKYPSIEKKKPLGGPKITQRVGGLVSKWTK